MTKVKKILSILGINTFTAVKKHYNDIYGENHFYIMLNRRLKQDKKDPKELAYFLRHELHHHFKEYCQYQ